MSYTKVPRTSTNASPRISIPIKRTSRRSPRFSTRAPRATSRDSAVEPAAGETEQSLRQENYHRDEDDAERDQVGELVAEQPRQEFARELEEPGPDDRPDQRADAANHVEDDGVARSDEIDEIGRGELIPDRVQHAGEPSKQPRQHHRYDLATLDRV